MPAAAVPILVRSRRRRQRQGCDPGRWRQRPCRDRDRFFTSNARSGAGAAQEAGLTLDLRQRGMRDLEGDEPVPHAVRCAVTDNRVDLSLDASCTSSLWRVTQERVARTDRRRRSGARDASRRLRRQPTDGNRVASTSSLLSGAHRALCYVDPDGANRPWDPELATSASRNLPMGRTLSSL